MKKSKKFFQLSCPKHYYKFMIERRLAKCLLISLVLWLLPSDTLHPPENEPAAERSEWVPCSPPGLATKTQV
jgi:hypothetical protein